MQHNMPTGDSSQKMYAPTACTTTNNVQTKMIKSLFVAIPVIYTQNTASIDLREDTKTKIKNKK